MLRARSWEPRLVPLVYLCMPLLFLLACSAPAPAQDEPVMPVDVGQTVQGAFPPPPGARRIQADGFGAYVRQLKLRDGPVRTHKGDVVVGHDARVIDLPLVRGDLQQCADSILRIRGEYLLSVGVDPVFHATSGDAMPWSRYRDGERARAQGNRLVWSNVGTPASWEHYLQAVFMWAGTASMQTSETVADPHVDPGDVLVQGGFPGHAVLVLDVAIQGDKTWVLIGEGFMPAMDFHVELGPDDGWWPFTEGVALPHWTLPRDTLRTWR